MSTAKGIINSSKGGKFVAVFIIDEIQYLFSGNINSNPGAFTVSNAILNYTSVAELTGTRTYNGQVGISTVKFAINNGTSISGALPVHNYIDPASTVQGSETWSMA